MDILYAPWRQKYLESTHKKTEGCVFCLTSSQDNDTENLILGRYKHNFVIMNKYPYNGGHLLIVPFKHVANLNELSSEAATEMMVLIQATTKILKKVFNNEGTNVGINMGKAAGAGIPDHLHTHVLPRWSGDTNFMPVLADAKQVSVDMQTLYKTLKPNFETLLEEQAL